jgi:hypothetical protein
MMSEPDCDHCDIANKSEAIFWAGVFVGMLLSFIVFWLVS